MMAGFVIFFLGLLIGFATVSVLGISLVVIIIFRPEVKKITEKNREFALTLFMISTVVFGLLGGLYKDSLTLTNYIFGGIAFVSVIDFFIALNTPLKDAREN